MESLKDCSIIQHHEEQFGISHEEFVTSIGIYQKPELIIIIVQLREISPSSVLSYSR